MGTLDQGWEMLRERKIGRQKYNKRGNEVQGENKKNRNSEMKIGKKQKKERYREKERDRGRERLKEKHIIRQRRGYAK